MADTDSSFAITVLGPVAARELGHVYPHEHLATTPPPHIAEDTDLVLDDAAEIVLDLAGFTAAGGRTIVELTTPDYGRDVETLAELSRRSGVNLIAATGLNKALYSEPHVQGRDIEELVESFVTEIRTGVAGTGVRCGVIKVGTSLNAIRPTEEVVLRAGARAHLATGCPITTHTERGTLGERQLDIFEEEGVSPSAVTIGHLDFCPDFAEVQRVAERGAFIEFDQVPKAKYAVEDEVLRRTTTLSRAGHAAQILISGDFSRKSYFEHWGGGPGLGYLLGPFRQRLNDALALAGLDSERIVSEIFVSNPARALSFRGPGTAQTAAAVGWRP